MSLVKIQGNASGTGIFTVAAPATNTDRTLTLPDGTGTIATAESTLSQFNASGSAPVYACRAWVNFNGTGTVAIRASGNVSSITDNGIGDYTVNFTTAMPDANYAPTMMCGFDTDSGSPNGHIAEISRDAAPTTTALRVDTMSTGGGITQRDMTRVNIAVFR